MLRLNLILNRSQLGAVARWGALGLAALGLACSTIGGDPAVGDPTVSDPSVGDPTVGDSPVGDPANEDSGATIRRELAAMGTWLTIEVTAGDRAGALAASEAAHRAIRDTERRLSTWTDDSELARLNAGRPFGEGFPGTRTSAELERAFEWQHRTGSAFHPAAGALVDVYDLRAAGRWPSPSELDRAVEATASFGDEGLPIGSSVPAGARIEEGGFAKGAALDAALDALRVERGVRSARLDFGGQLARLGAATRAPVALADPLDRGAVAFEVDSRAAHVATTSNAVRSLRVDGRDLPHVIDPRSGRPVDSDASVSVFASSGLDADALSTALFVLGPDRGLELVEQLHGVEAVYLLPDSPGPRARTSSGLSGLLSPSR